jgi:hypothetical protein
VASSARNPRRAKQRTEDPSSRATQEELSAILEIVDALALLAADLWFEGKLDRFPVAEEFSDGEED